MLQTLQLWVCTRSILMIREIPCQEYINTVTVVMAPRSTSAPFTHHQIVAYMHDCPTAAAGAQFFFSFDTLLTKHQAVDKHDCKK